MSTEDDTIRSMYRRQHQSGMISIMVTMIMIVVISLIVLGFATVSRSEQRSTADNQLSVQAFYAAESGVNDARAAIDRYMSGGAIVPPAKKKCDDYTNYPALQTESVIDAAHKVSYSCVLISTANSSLSYQLGYASVPIPISVESGNLNSMTLQWAAGQGNPTATTNCNLAISHPMAWPTSANWNCPYPVLRIDMVNMDTGGAPLNRDDWANNTATMFLVPEASGGRSNTRFTPGTGNVQIVPVPCGANGPCSLDIQPLSSNNYYLRVSTLYVSNTRLILTSKNNVTFVGAQAQIDVTGKAQDVLRRILVAVNLTAVPPVPDYAFMSTDSVCKRYQITNDSFSIPSDPNSSAPGADGNPLCAGT